MSIKIEQAEKAITKAKQNSILINAKMNITIVGTEANLDRFKRMDSAWLGSLGISIKKAKATCYFNTDSGLFRRLSQPGQTLHSIEHSNNSLITFLGGVPIKNELGKIINAMC